MIKAQKAQPMIFLKKENLTKAIIVKKASQFISPWQIKTGYIQRILHYVIHKGHLMVVLNLACYTPRIIIFFWTFSEKMFSETFSKIDHNESNVEMTYCSFCHCKWHNKVGQ